MMPRAEERDRAHLFGDGSAVQHVHLHRGRRPSRRARRRAGCVLGASGARCGRCDRGRATRFDDDVREICQICWADHIIARARFHRSVASARSLGSLPAAEPPAPARARPGPSRGRRCRVRLSRSRARSKCGTDRVDVRVAPLPPSLPHPPPARASSRPPLTSASFPRTPRSLPPRARRSYNRRQADFAALKEYNDYLETVEDIIFNLCEERRARDGGARGCLPPRERRRDRAPEPAKRRGGGAPSLAAPVAMDHPPGTRPRTRGRRGACPRPPTSRTPRRDANRRRRGRGGPRPRRDPPRAPLPRLRLPTRGYHAQAQILPVPTAVPAPLSAGKMQEGGHGRHAHHAGWNDAEDTAEGRARRDAAVARACGVDGPERREAKGVARGEPELCARRRLRDVVAVSGVTINSCRRSTLGGGSLDYRSEGVRRGGAGRRR